MYTKQYRGYTIDGLRFRSEQEIDEFIRQYTIRRYRQAYRRFAAEPSLEASAFCDEIAQELRACGLTPAEIEAFELDVIQASA